MSSSHVCSIEKQIVSGQCSTPRTSIVGRAVGLALVGYGLGLAALTIGIFRDCVVDDAFISLRYVQNVLAGHGFVYNPGDRIEGVTNLGFVLAVYGLALAGINILTAARVLGVVGAAVAIILGPAAILPSKQGHHLERALARLMCLANFGFIYYAWTGMETCFFAGVVAGIAYACSRMDMRFGAVAGVLAGIAFMVRPDGLLVGLLCLILCMVRHGLFATLRSRGPWIFAAIVAGFMAWRYSYYHALMPNTAAVKSIGLFIKHGLPWYATFGDDLVEFFAQTGGVLAVLLILLGLVYHADRWRSSLGIVICTAVLAFEIYAGGDWMIGYRYLQPMVPIYYTLVCIGAVKCFRCLFRDDQAILQGVMGVTIALVISTYCWSFALQFQRDANEYPNFVQTSRDLKPAAEWVGQHYPPEYQITCWRIGALGYYSGLRLIDTVGLTDRTIALAQRDSNSEAIIRYLHSRRPELAMEGGQPGEPAPENLDLYGLPYRFVREFPQGRHQTWRLYERADLPKRDDPASDAAAHLSRDVISSALTGHLLFRTSHLGS